ncbi:RNA helicase [Bacidia gigantensis]|uniref:RNA helicase n=1 Tax=Bacidia gigantensis TaxID=2732470 RepID=UPI001D04F5E3|nr:RNA helicase [Bacidia gigantensis]KAG8531485.1 RNA helicase [Bacidia gigantensis]
MTLSPKVGQRTTDPSNGGRRTGRVSGGAFAGMNRTSVNESNLHRQQGDDVQPRRHGQRSSNGRARSQTERDPYHALKMQKALSAVPYTQRSSVKAAIQRTEDFEDFPLLPVVQESIASQALSGMTDIAPTPIQSLAIPALSRDRRKMKRDPAHEPDPSGMDQFLLAAETGSGKTLAYLLPVLDAIKRAEMADVEQETATSKLRNTARKDANSGDVEPPSIVPHSTTGRPRAIILLPTSELVTQVGNVVKLLSHKIKFRSALISSAYTPKVIRNRLFSQSGIDVLVSTPHLLASISVSDPNVLSRVTHLVVDEADSLLDRSFAPSTSTVLDKTTPSLKQLILCSATIPRSLDSYLHKRFPQMRRLVTPNLHAIPRRVQLGVVDVDKQPYQGNKLLACADTIWSIGKAANEGSLIGNTEGKITRLLVFVNERERTEEVAQYLNSKGIDSVALTRDTPESRQSEVLAEFTSRTPDNVATRPSSRTLLSTSTMPAKRTSPPPKRHLANTQVLVSTDLGSRGIDTLAVRHVILFDVPHSTVDFIHRLGRTGRMGRRGRGIVLVGKHDRKDVVKEVREGMYKGQALI